MTMHNFSENIKKYNINYHILLKEFQEKNLNKTKKTYVKYRL